ncbi:MAG TPA: type II CAAX endopeptidase family protein [Anaerolineales bacterium]|nr:type II CAAX endopeptidase family protein [Anaerolineales bacterium]
MSEIQPTQERSILEQILVSQDEPRLRAGWRLLIQIIIFLFLGTVVFVTAVFLGFEPGSGSLAFLLEQVLNIIVYTGSVFIARRWLDKRSFESLGLKLNQQSIVDVLIGIGIAFVQMGFIYLLMLWLNWLTFEGFAWQFDPIPVVITGVLTFFAAFILVGWNEELFSRGYHLQTIASGTSLFWGVIISSAVFGALHIANPGATWISTVGIFIAGIFFAYAYIRTKQLWLPIGLHIGWNFAEGVVFGFPVSGLVDIYKLIRIQVTGPEIWTGGAFGPEAGLIVLPSLIVGALLIYLYTTNRNANV